LYIWYLFDTFPKFQSLPHATKVSTQWRANNLRVSLEKRYEKLDAMAYTAMHRIYNLVNGAVWAAIPKWAYIIFAIAVLAAGGFGFGFFYMLKKLQTGEC